MKMCIKNPVSNEFVNPFSKKVEELSKKFDNATTSRDYDELERLLSVAESELSNENIASQARIHYSMGTVYSDFAQLKIFQRKNQLNSNYIISGRVYL